MRAAFDERTRLVNLFKAKHKRAEKVGLFLGSVGDPKGQQTYSIRAHFAKEDEAEARWFKEESVK